MKSAMAERNPKAISLLLTPNFSSEDVSGKQITAEQMINQVCSLPKDSNKKSSTTLLSIKADNNIATVKQHYYMTTSKIDPNNTANMQAVELNAESTDTWVNNNGTWRLQRTVTDKMSYKINGKVVVAKERAH